jgi:hypothetical protein
MLTRNPISEFGLSLFVLRHYRLVQVIAGREESTS